MDEVTMSHFNNILSEKDTEHQLVFYSPHSKYKVIGNSIVNNLLRETLKELRITKPITVHGLRHTHASVLLYKKVSIQYVSERLGHSNIETTLNKYAHLIAELYEEDELKTVNIFNDINSIVK
ncbi:tyrosine-type recombinase/integrase [Radiobacillus deserti]|uniref:Tyrosine-type recombinase/integrase n=1 Tax=Radiobacillus deserti TaxID=2594883 RepID=A0A516KDG6_9BACI|nr:tyrosine-type recombinase/integrase [Radiobacillus deserti]QDP39453.1 tyrosine-type recombinase/integrase [Radiobacillus deserti]